MNDAKFFPQDLSYLANQTDLEKMDKKELLYQLLELLKIQLLELSQKKKP